MLAVVLVHEIDRLEFPLILTLGGFALRAPQLGAVCCTHLLLLVQTNPVPGLHKVPGALPALSTPH